MRVETIPELDIPFVFCQVVRMNEGVDVIYKFLAIL